MAIATTTTNPLVDKPDATVDKRIVLRHTQGATAGLYQIYGRMSQIRVGLTVPELPTQLGPIAIGPRRALANLIQVEPRYVVYEECCLPKGYQYGVSDVARTPDLGLARYWQDANRRVFAQIPNAESSPAEPVEPVASTNASAEAAHLDSYHPGGFPTMRDRSSDQHRRVGALKAGRSLGPDEVVHHQDEDKTHNQPANLTVESRSAHTAAHNKARGLSKLRSALRMVKEGRKLY